MVLLCASTLESTRILMNSAPGGLANSSGTLGHYLMDHIFGGGAAGKMPELKAQPWSGPPDRPTGMYIPRFRNLREGERHDFLRGYGYQGIGLRSGGTTLLALAAFGECLPREHNRITLSSTRDDWGIPLPRIDFEWSDNERAMRRDATEQGVAMLEAVGANEVFPRDGFGMGGEGIHEMGTARMGRDPATSVLNAHNQAHDVPNLFVVDGASMTTSACQNPSLTYMAITARACDHIISRFKRNEL